MILAARAQLVEGEEGDGEAEESPGQDVSGVMLVVSHPGYGDQHRVHHQDHLGQTIIRVSSSSQSHKSYLIGSSANCERSENFPRS